MNANLRKAMLASGGTIGAVAMLLALVILFGNTAMGQRSIEWLVLRLTDGQVTLNGLDGRFPEGPRVRRLELRDSKGLWLTADDVAVDWAPLAYLWNKIEIKSIAARQIDVLRRPVETAGSEGQGPHIEIGALNIKRLNVTEAVAWRPASITLSGKIDYRSLDDARIDIAARRLDGPGTYRIDFDVSKAAISGSADIREPANGLIGGLAGLPDLGPLSLQARASGPRNAQSVVLTLTAGALRMDARALVDLAGRTARIGVSAHAPAMAPGPDLSWSSLTLEANASGAFSKLDIGAQLRIFDLRAWDVRARIARADIQGKDGDVAVEAEIGNPQWDGLAGDFFGGAPIRLRAKARIDNRNNPADFEISHALATVKGHATFGSETKANAAVDIHSLAPFANLAGLDLAGTAKMSASIAVKNGKTSAVSDGLLNVTGGDETLTKIIGGKVKLGFAGVFRKGDVLLERASLDDAFARLDAKGGLESGSLRIDWTGALRDLSRVASTLSGSLDVRGHVKGATSRFEVTVAGDGRIAGGAYAKGPVHIAARIGGLPDAPQGSVNIDGRINGGTLQMQARLEQRDGALSIAIDKGDWKSLRARANLLLAHGARLPSGKIVLEEGQLADLRPFLGIDVSGSLSASASLNGGKEPTLARLSLAAKNLTVEGAHAAVLTLGGDISNPVARPTADLKLAATGIAISGFDGDLQAQIAGPADAVDIRILSKLSDADGYVAKIESAARMDATKDLISLNVFKANYRGETADLVAPARFDVAKGITFGKLELNAAGAKLVAQGRVSPTLELTATARNVTARFARLFSPDLNIGGVISADAKLSGTLSAPRGAISLHGTGLAFEGAAKGTEKGELSATALLNASTAQLDARLIAGKSISLSVSGTAPLTADAPMNLKVKGATDLALINPALNAEGRNLRGVLNLDGVLTGSQSQPHVEGQAILSGADYQDYVQGIHLADVSARIGAMNNKIALTDFKARAGKGTVSASGDINLWAPGMPVNLSIKASNARFLASNLMTMDGDATLKLTGLAQGHVDLAGDVRIDQGEVNLPESLPRNVAVLDVRRKGQSHAPPAKSNAPVIGLNLTLTSPGRLFVRGRGLEAEVSGRLTVAGTNEMPDVRGGFTMRRGEFSLAGQSLNFTSGRLGFDGTGVSSSLDPSLNFVAESTSGSVTAKLQVTGYASAPKIKLSSTPYLPQDEVLAHLLFQQSVKQLGPLQVAQIADGLSTLTGIGSGINPLSRVRKGLGLDRLAVGTGRTGTGATLEAGKYVMNGIYIGAKQETGGGTSAKVQVDLTERLKAQAIVNTGTPANVTGSAAQVDRGSSIGLSYQFDY